MRRFLAAATPCLPLLIAGCATPTQFLKKNYPEADLQGETLLIYPVLQSQITVDNTEDFRDDFEDVMAEPEEFFDTEWDSLAGEVFPRSFGKVVVAASSDTTLRPLTPDNSIRLEEKIGKEPFEIRVPKREGLQEPGPRFILVMDQVVFSRNVSSYQHQAPGAVAPVPPGMNAASAAPMPMTMTSTKKSIAVGFNYAVYDYEAGETVGYGFAAGEKTFQFAMTRSDWYAAMEDAFAQVAKYTPFRK